MIIKVSHREARLIITINNNNNKRGKKRENLLHFQWIIANNDVSTPIFTKLFCWRCLGPQVISTRALPSYRQDILTTIIVNTRILYYLQRYKYVTVSRVINHHRLEQYSSVYWHARWCWGGNNTSILCIQSVINLCDSLKGDQPSSAWTVFFDLLTTLMLQVFQRRQDGSENFYRTWNQFTLGFGNLRGEFWLGKYWSNKLAVV